MTQESLCIYIIFLFIYQIGTLRLHNKNTAQGGIQIKISTNNKQPQNNNLKISRDDI